MKKSKRTRPAKSKRKSNPIAAPTAEAAPMDRRRFMRLARNGAIGVAVLGGAGFFGARSVMATIAEHDLTRVGNGKPAVVQVHDPQCPTCTALQKETRRAMSQFGECDMQFLVANIKTADGSEFAANYGVPHVTLLLFDGEGELIETLRGMRYREELSVLLAQHHETYKAL